MSLLSDISIGYLKRQQAKGEEEHKATVERNKAMVANMDKALDAAYNDPSLRPEAKTELLNRRQQLWGLDVTDRNLGKKISKTGSILWEGFEPPAAQPQTLNATLQPGSSMAGPQAIPSPDIQMGTGHQPPSTAEGTSIIPPRQMQMGLPVNISQTLPAPTPPQGYKQSAFRTPEEMESEADRLTKKAIGYEGDKSYAVEKGKKRADAEYPAAVEDHWNYSNGILWNQADGTVKKIQDISQDKEVHTYREQGTNLMVTQMRRPDGTEYDIRSTTPAAENNNELLNAIRATTLAEKTKASPGQVINLATGNPVDLKANEAALLTDMNTLIDQNAYVKKLMDKGIETGAIRGWATVEGMTLPVVQDTLDPNLVELVSEIQRLNNIYVYVMTGKQISESESVRLALTAPGVKYNNETNKRLINNFARSGLVKANNYMQIHGWGFAPGTREDSFPGLDLNNFGPGRGVEAPKPKTTPNANTSPGNTTGGLIYVTAPDGVSYPFKTQAEANAFKKAAGIK